MDIHMQVQETETMSTSEEPPLILPPLKSLPAFPEKIYIRSANPKTSTFVTLQLKTLDTGLKTSVEALLDCGATGQFLDMKFVQEHKLNTRRLPRPIPVYNVDGSLNKSGSIREEVDIILTFQNHTERTTFAVTDLGDKDAILGHTWLYHHNPEIDWRTGEVKFTRCPPQCHIQVKQKKKVKKIKKHYGRLQALPSIAEETEEAEKTHVKIEEVQDEEMPKLMELDDEEDVKFEEGDRIFIAFVSPEARQINAAATMSQKLAEQAHKQDSGRKTFEELVPERYHDFKHVFSKESFDELPPRKPWDHAIELKPGSEPQRCKLYPLSPNEQTELAAFLEENLRTGRIRPSKSPMASPVFLIKKKDGTLRLVQDYRKLNEMTIRNSYPLPLISDLINKLKKAKYFTKLDIRWGYNNVRIKEGDEWKAAFRTNRGLFEPLVMFFGLTNSPATFQTMMNEIFQELIDEGVVIVYIDDILIFTETLEEHRRVTKEVLAILAKHQLYLKPEKCEFEKDKIEYLGLIISNGKMEMDPVKIDGVATWPEPTCVKDVQSFIGFVNFYRRFIQAFAEIARPLHNLTRKDIPWTWKKEHKEEFEGLKDKITSAPVLIFPSDDKPYKVEVDASNYAHGGVLSQQGEDGK